MPYHIGFFLHKKNERARCIWHGTIYLEALINYPNSLPSLYTLKCPLVITVLLIFPLPISVERRWLFLFSCVVMLLTFFFISRMSLYLTLSGPLRHLSHCYLMLPNVFYYIFFVAIFIFIDTIVHVVLTMFYNFCISCTFRFIWTVFMAMSSCGFRLRPNASLYFSIDHSCRAWNAWSYDVS